MSKREKGVLGREELRLIREGDFWVRVLYGRTPHLTIRVRFIYRGDGHTLRISEVNVKGDSPIQREQSQFTPLEVPVEAQALRALPLARIEALINKAQLDSEDSYVWLNEKSDEEIGSDELPQVMKASATQPVTDLGLPHLERPTGKNLPVEFYELVAAYYNRLVSLGLNPVTELAEIGNVPRTTAARWVSRAREKGFLAKARRGRIS